MTFTITKTFEFSASHQLEGLPHDHPCSRLHGHNYVLRVELQGEQLNPVGFVFDYRALSVFKTLVDDVLDHRHLNEVMAPSTAEALARWLYHELDSLLIDATAKGTPEEGRYMKVGELAGARSRPDDWFTLAAVVVSETPKTSAEYRP